MQASEQNESKLQDNTTNDAFIEENMTDASSLASNNIVLHLQESQEQVQEHSISIQTTSSVKTNQVMTRKHRRRSQPLLVNTAWENTCLYIANVTSLADSWCASIHRHVPHPDPMRRDSTSTTASKTIEAEIANDISTNLDDQNCSNATEASHTDHEESNSGVILSSSEHPYSSHTNEETEPSTTAMIPELSDIPVQLHTFRKLKSSIRRTSIIGAQLNHAASLDRDFPFSATTNQPEETENKASNTDTNILSRRWIKFSYILVLLFFRSAQIVMHSIYNINLIPPPLPNFVLIVSYMI